MKIKSLWISEYKNIKNLHLDFKSNLISLLVGKNGLGKSNLIEALAIIFRDLDLLKSKEDFENWSYENFEYDLLYVCYNSEIRVLCRKGSFQVWRKLNGAAELPSEVSFRKFNNLKHEVYLPKYIIGYYSGENKRIRDVIRPYEEQVWKDLKNNKGLENDLRRLFFSENYHSQMILLTLLLYKDQNENPIFQERVAYLIENFTSFNSLAEVSLELKSPLWYNPGERKHSNKGINLLEENLLRGVEFPFWDIKGRADKIISFLYNNTISDPIYYLEEEIFQEKIELNNIDLKKVSSEIPFQFDSAMHFFGAFETLKQIDVIFNVILKVKSLRSGSVFDFTQLSEGEAQLITVLGLILITGNEECLFLLDEPDTHLNPQWQREYVDLIDRFTLDNMNSHIIVATHSPLIVQAAEKADIFLYKLDDDGQIVVKNEDFTVQNWRIDQVLTSEYFDLHSARPAHLDYYMSLREKILTQGNISADIEKELKNLENEYGVLPTGETRDEIEAMLLINNIVKRYNDKTA
ncbi:AAA family ATPase [Dyadobacter bucti]|uniref:AAA family ATPase n=1 Tax=Dyadobacter bucti TaxID=2572203 RepID=UPI00140D254F|nr:AAA family ATPase [Dyadobacter bucti]